MDQVQGESLPDEAIVEGQARPVTIDARSSQFQVRVGEHLAFLEFQAKNGALSLYHTEVPPPLRGKGVGEALARAGLNYARHRGMTVKPYCPFVAQYVKRHAEYRDLLDPEFSGAS